MGTGLDRMEGQLVLRLPAKLKRTLEKAAAADRRRLSDFVRLLLEDAMTARKKRDPAR